MTQFWAMLVDAYRELNSRKLFWVVLAISAVVMLFYAGIGFDPEGFYFFYGLWHIDSDFVHSNSPISAVLYRSIFASFILGIWLSWAAIILALISTTTIFPDFVAAGSIDLVLAKPIGRVRLFLTKYVLSLLFVLLQVGIFCVGVFLCIGWRTGEWNWLIFAAIPLVTLFFSYLFSFNVLIGVWTRSALTALLLTVLLWAGMFSVNLAEGILLRIHTDFIVDAEQYEHDRDEYQATLAELEDTEDNASRRVRLEGRKMEAESAAQEKRSNAAKLDPWISLVSALKYPTPKSGETIGLLDRWLSRDTDITLNDILEGDVKMNEKGEWIPDRKGDDSIVNARLNEEYNSRSLWYVLGTSLAFEFVMLGLACVIFVRRDY